MEHSKLPWYVDFILALVFICLLTTIFYLGSAIIMPFLLSIFLAVLLSPVVDFLQGKCRLPQLIAISLAILLFLLLMGSIIYFISWQITDFMDDWPKIKKNAMLYYSRSQEWVRIHMNVNYPSQEAIIKAVKENSFTQGNKFIGSTLDIFSEVMLDAVLIPIYMFLLLLYKHLFQRFSMMLVARKNHTVLVKILNELEIVLHSYLIGLLLELCIVWVLTTGGLLIIGVPYAVLLGAITAILNLIPYVGILFAGILSIVAVLIDGQDPSQVIGILVINTVVQFIDNNIIVPKVVASQIKINAIASILGVLVGGAIAGVVGMFLALPALASVKTVCDNIEPLKPWGVLLSDDLSGPFHWEKLKNKMKRKPKEVRG